MTIKMKKMKIIEEKEIINNFDFHFTITTQIKKKKNKRNFPLTRQSTRRRIKERERKEMKEKL
jgi:hypothetical protein